MDILANIKLNISEIFSSIQGESTFAGLPCVFIRLQGCNLRCNWCDTPYALDSEQNKNMRFINSIINEVKSYDFNYVCITGGEPLAQKNVNILIDALIKGNYLVSLETNGSYSLENVNKKVVKIVDFKTPSSKMLKFNDFNNINFLTKKDEIKFVIADYDDFIWSMEKINKFDLLAKVNSVLMSAVFDRLEPSELAEWILNNNSSVRLQLQLHKYIWSADKRGV